MTNKELAKEVEQFANDLVRGNYGIADAAALLRRCAKALRKTVAK